MPINKNYLPYSEAKELIQEGDILLFRGKTVFSWLIMRASDGLYSHVGIASWVFNDKNEKVELEVIEFKEWKGSRAVSLENYVAQWPGRIDVFRPNPSHTWLEFDPETKTVRRHKLFFFGRTITAAFRKLTGLPYGWKRIWWLAKNHFIFSRAFADPNSFDDTLKEKDVYPVCSTAVAYLFHKYYIDLVHFRSNERTEPSDISRSPILNYLFTLNP
jgi:hypothetical protein